MPVNAMSFPSRSKSHNNMGANATLCPVEKPEDNHLRFRPFDRKQQRMRSEDIQSRPIFLAYRPPVKLASEIKGSYRERESSVDSFSLDLESAAGCGSRDPIPSASRFRSELMRRR
jgi:hypothetical protein